MRRTLISMATLAALAATGCNAVLGAEEPTVVNSAGDIIDVDGLLEPPHGSTCGNGITEAEERCDDGNQDAGDGCSNCDFECGTFTEALHVDSGHCYLIEGVAASQTNPSAMSSGDAATECAKWGGTLAAITSVEELAFVQHFVDTPDFVNDGDTWIGARRPQGGGEFEWDTGEPWGFVSWASDPPAGQGGCLALDKATLLFEEVACNAPLAYLCERALFDQPTSE